MTEASQVWEHSRCSLGIVRVEKNVMLQPSANGQSRAQSKEAECGRFAAAHDVVAWSGRRTKAHGSEASCASHASKSSLVFIPPSYGERSREAQQMHCPALFPTDVRGSSVEWVKEKDLRINDSPNPGVSCMRQESLQRDTEDTSRNRQKDRRDHTILVL